MINQHPILSIRIAGKGNNSSSKDMLCIRIGLTESSNMLHYSNASSIEKNRRYLVIKGGACLVALARRGRQHRSRPGQQRRRSRSLPERRGGRNNEYNANISMTMEDMTMRGARCALTRQEVVPAKGENIRESILGVSRFRMDEPEGESCVFAMPGMRGGRMGCASGFVSSF